jgi:hypothetical protein
MNLRLRGLAHECDQATVLLEQTPGLVVVDRRGPYPDRPPSVLVRLYLEVRLATDRASAPGSPVTAATGTTGTTGTGTARRRRRGGRR